MRSSHREWQSKSMFSIRNIRPLTSCVARELQLLSRLTKRGLQPSDAVSNYVRNLATGQALTEFDLGIWYVLSSQFSHNRTFMSVADQDSRVLTTRISGVRVDRSR